VAKLIIDLIKRSNDCFRQFRMSELLVCRIFDCVSYPVVPNLRDLRSSAANLNFYRVLIDAVAGNNPSDVTRTRIVPFCPRFARTITKARPLYALREVD